VRGRREGQAFLLDMGEYIHRSPGQPLSAVLSPMQLGLREKSVMLWNDCKKIKGKGLQLDRLASPRGVCQKGSRGQSEQVYPEC
jgi:hypothetical protein